MSPQENPHKPHSFGLGLSSATNRFLDYAQPPVDRILNHFHPLELFLTHCHHPSRVTKSGCG
jgi:hypothetical protein